MGRLLKQLGSFIIFPRGNSCVRSSIIAIAVNLLLLAGLIFTIEIILVVLGIGDVFLPLTKNAWSFLKDLIF